MDARMCEAAGPVEKALVIERRLVARPAVHVIPTAGVAASIHVIGQRRTVQSITMARPGNILD